MKKHLLSSIFLAVCVAFGSALLTRTPAAGLPASGASIEIQAAYENSPPAGIDLDVTYISRAPLYNAYCVEYPWDVLNQPGIPYLCSGTEEDQRWPEPGEVVTFTAHIVNKGTQASPAFDYIWEIDSTLVATGTLPSLAPAAEITATYLWPWGHGLSGDEQRALGEHTVGFVADPANKILETYEDNNQLEDFTRAMSFRITFTPEMYIVYNTPIDPSYPYSTEDWIQKQIAAMNANFASAIYPVTPQGSALRVRIDSIGVADEYPAWDGQHDGGWFLRDEVRCEGCGYYDISTDIDWGLVHELSHQVALIDLYAIGVYASNVFAQGLNGQPANVGFGWVNGGLMGGGDISPYTEHNRYSSHSAGGSNTMAGYRNGYYGAYLFDIPAENYLLILDNQGNPAPGVDVNIYQRTGPWDWTGHMGVDNLPEISGSTDEDGIFHLPNRSAQGGTTTLNSHTMHDNPFGVIDIIGNQGLLLVHLSQGEHEEFHWLDITQFNLAYWIGDVDSHTFTIDSHVPPAGAPAAPQISTVRVEGVRTTLAWLPSPGGAVDGYRVYRATPPRYQYESASNLLTTTTFDEEFWGNDGQHRLYGVAAVAEDGTESGFSELVYAPGLDTPLAVAALDSGERLVLNKSNLYPLLNQHSDGRYWQRPINVHYDLWNTSFLALDPAGRVILSGFGEFPSGRAAVRLYDAEIQPLWAFGEEGAAEGQFDAPSGVAWWGEACPYLTQPYQGDEHTLLLAHFNGDTDGVDGETATAEGISFEAGKFGQGILLDQDDTLTYPVADNITHTHGAVEFWIKPTWDGGDGGNHTLFWWGEGDNFFHLRKDPISNLVFDYFYSGGSCGAPLNVADWEAGEWHHLGFTWEENVISLFVDGKLVNKSICGGTALPGSSTFYVGSDQYGGNSIEAVIDELRISDYARIGLEEPCGRILVADSNQHRLQAFDFSGKLLTVFGSYGSSAGKFNSPQGLAVDSSGRVFVADQGNDRVVVLEFDGTAFRYTESFTADFEAPGGLALDGFDNLYVADTGNHRIVLLNPAGNLLAEYTEPNDGYSGSFETPRGVAVTAEGEILVADTGNQRVVSILRPHWVNTILLPTICK